MNPNTLGGIGCAVAALFFGTQTIFVKAKVITKHAEMQTNLVCLAFALGILLFSLVLFAFILAGQLDEPAVNGGWPTPFTWEGFAQAWIFAPAKTLLLLSVRVIGVAVAGAIVAGVLSAVAWVVGVSFLGDPFHLVALAGICMFLLGVIGMVYVRSRVMGMADVRTKRKEYPNKVNNVNVEPQQTLLTGPPLLTTSFWATQAGGMMLGFFSGAIYGFQGVPLHWSPKESAYENAASMGVTTMFVMLLLHLPPMLYVKSTHKLTFKQLVDVREESTGWNAYRLLLLPIMGGVCFGIGGVGQQLGIEKLGSSAALPMSQLQLIVAAAWGIAFYKEIYQWQHIVVYTMFALLAIAGSVLLHPPWIK